MKLPFFDSLALQRTVRVALLTSLLASPAFIAVATAQETPAAPVNEAAPANEPAPTADAAPATDVAPTQNPPVTQPTVAQPAAPTETPATPAVTVPTDPDERLRLQTQYYNGGLAALKGNRWAEAGEAFEKTLTVAPEDSMARMLLGYVRLKQERYDDALTALQQAAAQGTALDARTRAIIQNNIGMAYWSKNRPLLAIPAYERAVQLDKTYNDARYNLAFALLSQNQSKESVPHFQQLITANPKDATLQDGLAQAYENMAQWAQAFAAYRKAIELNPKEASYPLNLALAILRSDPDGVIPGRRDAAGPYLRTAIKLNSEAAPAYLHLGLILIDKQRWPEAQDLLRQYVAMRPNDFVGHFNLALAYDYNAKFTQALQTYENALKLQPQDAPTKNNIGRIQLKQKKYDEAVATFNEALAIDANFIDARNNLALALTEKGDLDGANTQWKSLITNAANELRGLPAAKSTEETPAIAKRRTTVTARLVAARAALAENYLKAKQFNEAANEYRNLLAISPNNVAAMSNRGLALYNTQQYAEALKLYDAIVLRDPKNAIAQNNRGVVLEAMNKKSDAITAYQKAVELKPDYTEAKSNLDRLRGGLKTG